MSLHVMNESVYDDNFLETFLPSLMEGKSLEI